MKNRIMMPLCSPDGIGGALGGVLVTVGQANGIIAGAITLITLYKQAREAWKAAHPDDQSPFLEDAELNDLLREDAGKGLVEINAVLAKYGVTFD